MPVVPCQSGSDNDVSIERDKEQPIIHCNLAINRLARIIVPGRSGKHFIPKGDDPITISGFIKANSHDSGRLPNAICKQRRLVNGVSHAVEAISPLLFIKVQMPMHIFVHAGAFSRHNEFRPFLVGKETELWD